MSANRLLDLPLLGQSVWMDFIRRDTILSGQLARWIEQDGLRGITSNPSIFEAAITGSDDYNATIDSLIRAGKRPAEIYEAIAVEDIQMAADAFRPTYEQLAGADGFVSLEVSPTLAHDTAATIDEARRLRAAVARPNVMIKVPATREGLPAIRQLIAEGMNINITLLFGVPRYEEVVEAYFAGLEDRVAAGGSLDRIASVASFFLSRIDTMIDARLDEVAAIGGPNAELARDLRGTLAIASAKVAREFYIVAFGSDRFARLRRRGARPQRLLWASTSAKDPRYSALKYIEPLIGPNTISTMPRPTFDAYRDHGQPALRLDTGADRAAEQLHQLASVTISLDHCTQQLEDEGVAKFVHSYDQLQRTLERAIGFEPTTRYQL